MVSAATEVIDGHEYVVFEITSNIGARIIKDYVDKNYYVKLVFRSNWSETVPYMGDAIYWCSSWSNRELIIDLNGYTVDTGAMMLDIECSHVSIYDSSPAGTGMINASAIFVATEQAPYITTLDLYGGTLNCKVSIGVRDGGSGVGQKNFNMYGGKLNGPVVTSGAAVRTNIAPHLNATYDADGNLIAAGPYDAYAVSSSDLASGACNYTYGIAWEISAAELANLEIPTNRRYYLWGRFKDEWYQLLTAL